MPKNDTNDNFKFIPSEIKSVLKEIRELASRPDTASDAYSRLETVIESSSPALLENLRKSFNESINLFMPKKRRKLEELLKGRFEAPAVQPAAKTPEPQESSLINDIRKELSFGNVDAAFDLFCDLVLSSERDFLIKNSGALRDFAKSFGKHDKKEANDLFEKRAGRSLFPSAAEKAALSNDPERQKRVSTETNAEKTFKDILELIKRPDRTSEAFARLEKFINESDNELIRKTGERINEVLNSFLPGKQKKLRELLSEKLVAFDSITTETIGDVSGVEIKTAIKEINSALSRPDAVADAYAKLYETISTCSTEELLSNEETIKNAINSFFPKKRRDLLRLFSGRLKKKDDAAWDIAHEEVLSEIRRRAAARINHDKVFGELSDVIMTCDDGTLYEYKDDIREISLFLPGILRNDISSLINKRIPQEEELHHEEPAVIEKTPVVETTITEPEIEADKELKSDQEPRAVDKVLEEQPPQKKELKVESEKQKYSYPIIHERFNFTEHAVVRTGQRGVTFDSIELAFQYGRQEHSRGAIYYVIGRAEVEEYKNVVPEIISHEGLHVVCSSDDGAIMTVFKNKDLNALKHKRNAPGKQRRRRFTNR